MLRCAECGSHEVFLVSIKTDKVDIGLVNEGTELKQAELPYYLGGYYCKNCQTLVSCVDDSALATEKQMALLKKLCEKEGRKVPLKLSMKEAGRMIWALRKKNTPLATEKQKNYIKKLLTAAGAEDRDLDGLNVEEASRLITELKGVK